MLFFQITDPKQKTAFCLPGVVVTGVELENFCKLSLIKRGRKKHVVETEKRLVPNELINELLDSLANWPQSKWPAHAVPLPASLRS